MLVVTRREGQKILIGPIGNPTGYIQVMRIKGDRVRIGVHLPDRVVIMREEVVEQAMKDADSERKSGTEKPKGRAAG